MADYVRRRIEPLLHGLDAEYLELIVGELEIATETRHGFSETVEDDGLGTAVVDILEAAGYTASRAEAEAHCDQILRRLKLSSGISLSTEQRDLATLDGCANGVLPTASTGAEHSAHTITEDQLGPSDQPSFDTTLHNSSFACAAIAIAVALGVLFVPTAQSSSGTALHLTEAGFDFRK